MPPVEVPATKSNASSDRPLQPRLERGEDDRRDDAADTASVE